MRRYSQLTAVLAATAPGVAQAEPTLFTDWPAPATGTLERSLDVACDF